MHESSLTLSKLLEGGIKQSSGLAFANALFYLLHRHYGRRQRKTAKMSSTPTQAEKYEVLMQSIRYLDDVEHLLKQVIVPTTSEIKAQGNLLAVACDLLEGDH